MEKMEIEEPASSNCDVGKHGQKQKTAHSITYSIDKTHKH